MTKEMRPAHRVDVLAHALFVEVHGLTMSVSSNWY